MTTPTDPDQDPRNTTPPGGGAGAPDPGYTSPTGGYATSEGAYGTPASSYGTPAPPPPSYGSSPTAGYAGPPAAAGGQLAEWPQRVLGYLIDLAIVIGMYIVLAIILAIVGAASDTLATIVLLLGWIAIVGFTIWQLVVQGQTGQTIGKRVIGIRLIGEQTGQPIGPVMSIVRAFAHIVDSIPCGVGYLWPLWDPKKQTFADKIVGTVVVKP